MSSVKPEHIAHLAPAGAFRALTEQLAGVIGEDFFREAVRRLAFTLDVEYAFISTRATADSPHVRLAAAWHVNRAVAGGELALEGTPAARTLAELRLWHEDNTADLYPKDRWLRKHGVRAYCAVAIRVADGRAIGHLGVMSRQPLQANDELFAILQMLAARTAAELHRQHLDEIQRVTATKLAACFRMSPGITGVGLLENFQITDISPSVERTLGYSPAELIGQSLAQMELLANPAERGEALRELKAGGRLVNRDITLRARNGAIRNARLSGEVIECDGQAYILFCLKDDTDYRAAMVQVQELDSVCKTLVSTAHDAIFIFPSQSGATDAAFSLVNDAACRLLDYARNDLLQLTSEKVIGIGDLKKLRHGLDSADFVNMELKLHGRTGAVIPCHAYAHSLTHNGERSVLIRCQPLREPASPGSRHQESGQNYRAFLENASEGVYQSTLDGLIINASPALARILGYDNVEEIITGKLNIAAQIYARPEQRNELLRRLEEQGLYVNQESQVLRRDGSTIWVCDSARAIKDEYGHTRYYQGTLQDISGRKRAEEALLRSEEKYRMLVDMNQDGVFLSQAGKLIYVNRAFSYMLGHEPEEMIGLAFSQLVASADDALLEQIVSDAADLRAMHPHEMHLRDQRDKRRVTASVVVSRISWRGRPAIMGTARDITEHKKAEQNLVHSAYHDTLTGLPNRGFFMDRLRQALESNGGRGAGKFAVLFLDLDRFKLINDSLGHSFGDRLLMAITKRLRTCLRPADLMARYGGDEFAILLEHLQNVDEATAVADRIHEELARAFNVNGRDMFSTASIGIAISAPQYQHPDELLRDADTAMYRAKAAGKAGYVVFDDAMHQQVKANLKLETELRHALQRNEFRVYFQPVMELASGRLTGFEALVRWAHPERGLVAPEQFLAVAEETGLIIPLGWWVMETACAQLAQWRKRHKHLSEDIAVSVNIANRQFAHWVLPQRVARVLDMTGIPAKNLCLEITETVFMDNPQLTSEIIGRLRSIGVNLQMDDFGTGYSSLSALRNFRLDTLKIDRSFIAGIEQNRSDRAIVRTITVLAADLGMDVVAEGIETARQLELLRALGCRRGQGYYFAKPFAANEVDRYLAALRPPKA